MDDADSRLAQLSGQMLLALQRKDMVAAYDLSCSMLDIDPNAAVAKEFQGLLTTYMAEKQAANDADPNEDEGEENGVAGGGADALDSAEDRADGTEDDPNWGVNAILARLERFEKEGLEAMAEMKRELVQAGILKPAVP